MDGFDELSEGLERLQRNAERLDGENSVPLAELFDPTFMRTHTEFTSFEEMLEESPWEIETQDDFEAIPEPEFDVFVREHTGFTSFEEMQQVAGNEWVRRELEI